MAVESRAQTLLVSHPHFKTSCLSPALTHHLLQEKITATASQMSPQDLHGRRGSRKRAGRFPWLFFPVEFPITPWDEQSPGCRAGSSRLECCLAPLPHASDVQDEVLLLSRNKFNPLEDSGGNRCHLTCPSHGFASVLGRRGAGLGSSSAPAIATLTACICLLPLARLQKSLSSR